MYGAFFQDRRYAGGNPDFYANNPPQQFGMTGQPQYWGTMSSDIGRDLITDPSYQFRLGEGLRGIEGSAAARGTMLSGRTLKDLMRYGQDYASQEYANAYNRLASLSGIGQTQSQSLGQQAIGYGSNLSNITTSSGEAQANAALAQGAAWQGTLGNIYNAWKDRPFTITQPVARGDAYMPAYEYYGYAK